jgi:hypothetical protein
VEIRHDKQRQELDAIDRSKRQNNEILQDLLNEEIELKEWLKENDKDGEEGEEARNEEVEGKEGSEDISIYSCLSDYNLDSGEDNDDEDSDELDP